MRSSILVAAAAFAAIVSDALAFAPGAALPSVAGRVTPTGALSGLEMMRHGNRKAKLGLAADQRKALMRALTTEVIRHGRITTTLARAKAVRGEVDRMIGLAKDGSLSSRRAALGYMYDKELVHSLFEAAPDRYGDREGGYTRVLRTLPRKGDNSKMGERLSGP